MNNSHFHPICHNCNKPIEIGDLVVECIHCETVIHKSCHLNAILNHGGEKTEDFISEKIQNWLTKQIDQHSKRLKSKFRK